MMAAYDLQERGLLPVEGMREVVSYIESFLVRRQLAGIPTNALNKLFVQFVEHLPQDETFPRALRQELSRQRRYWPGDEHLRQAIRTRPFYLSGRGPQRKIMILERLEQSYGHPEKIDFETASLTIEHVMPQTFSDEWREHLGAQIGDPTEVDEEHQSLVHTLGNLTLTAFNGTLSNSPFERKRQIYSASHLELNRALAEKSVCKAYTRRASGDWYSASVSAACLARSHTRRYVTEATSPPRTPEKIRPPGPVP
jgi:hypothetical protein